MSLNVKQKAIKIFDKFFANKHPETALRYLPIVAEIKRLKLQNTKILEVGSGSLGIVPYLEKPVDGLDIDFSGPKTPYLTEITGEADSLPFRKNSYEVVISVDVLEHLTRERRPKAIAEIIRVARKLAIIVTPTGEESENQDKKLARIWHKTHKESNSFLDQHVKNGLPRSEEILILVDQLLRKSGKRAKIHSKPLLNLIVREFLMRTWMSQNKMLYYLYLKGFLVFVPILKFANFGNCYRRIFVIEFTT